MKTNIANKIQNMINGALGIDALKIRLETSETLIASLRTQIKEQDARLEDSPTFRDLEREIEKATEDFITERGLDESIENALNDQDWDSIVSDALGGRHCPSVLDEMVTDAVEQQFGEQSFRDAALCAVAEAANRVASIGQSTPATWENFNNVVSGHLLPTLAALAAVRGGK